MAVDLGTARGRIELDVKGAIDASVQAGKSIQAFQATAATAMVAVGVAVGAVTTAVKLMEKGWQTFEKGAELDALQTRYERLADSIGSSGDALMTRLQDATNGMMTSAELISSATDIMSLGLGKTEDQTVRLATVVSKLGWDMQQVILTFANNSKMRLDALGLSVEDVTKRAKELEEQGYSTDEAFDLAVIEAGEKKIELLGDASQTTAGKIKVMKAAVQEVQDRFAMGVAEGFASSLDQMAGDVTTVADGLGDMAYGAGLLTRYLPAASEKVYDLAGQISPLVPLARELGVLLGVIGGTEVAADVLNERAILRADMAMTTYANTMADANDESQDMARRSLNLGAHLVIAGERFKEAADGGGKFGSQLDAVTEKAARTQAALEAAAQRAAAYGEAFGAVQADYVTELPDADKPLVAPQQDVTIRTRISGPTAEQAELAARYRDELERLGEAYTELTGGVGLYGVEQDKVNERLAEVSGEMAYYQGLLDALPPAVDNVTTAHQGLQVNVDAARQALYDQLVEIGAAPEVVTAYAAATGLMSQAQAEAALTAARVKLEIEALALKMSENPDYSLDAAMAELDALILKLENEAKPAADALPGILDEGGGIMAAQAKMLGEDVPANLAKGITDSMEEATTAATDAATAVIDATNAAFGTESPSTVFASTGGDLIAGLVQGVEDAQGDAVAVMERVAQASTDAWDETIDGADAIGKAIIDGVVAGVEANRGSLEAKMREIAAAAYQAAMDEINAHSPSVLFMDMGEAMIEGVIVGVDREGREMVTRMKKLAGDARDAFAQELLAFERFGRAGALADAAEGLLGVGRGVLGIQADALEANIDRATDDLTAALDGLRGAFGNTPIDNLLAMNPAKRAFFLRTLRSENAAGNMIVSQQLEAAIRLADERNALEEEYIRQQEALARLEAQRAQLDFLGRQLDLLQLIYDNNLDANLLEGLTLGLDANADDLVEAMRRAVEALIGAAEEDLEIHSPSRVGYRLTENFMEAMARGIRENADGPIGQLARAYDQMEAMGLRFAGLGASGNSLAGQWLGSAAAPTPTAADLAQHVTVYGGYNVTVEGQATADPLRALYFQSLGYQG